MTEHTDSTTEAQADSNLLSRRELLSGLAGATVSAAAISQVVAGEAKAQTAANTVASRSSPAAAIYTDRLQLVSISDPSSPNNGDFWYNDSA